MHIHEYDIMKNENYADVDVLGFSSIRAKIEIGNNEDRSKLLRAAKDVTQEWPDRRCHVKGPANMVTRVLESPSWPLVRSIHVEANRADEAKRFVQTLCRSGSSLQSLSGSFVPDDEAIRLLNPRRHFPGVRSLDLELGMDVTSTGVQSFLESMVPGTVEKLAIHYNSYSQSIHDALYSYAISEKIPAKLKILDLGFMSDDLGLAFMRKCKRPFEGIGRSSLTRSSLEVLCENERLASNLKTLDLSGYELGDGEMELLARSPYFQQLERLNLRVNNLSAAGVAALMKARFVSRLKCLDVSYNRLGDEGWEVIGGAPLGRLESLWLNATWAGRDGAIALAESDRLRRLRVFDMGENPMPDEGMSRLIDSELISQLEEWYFACTQIGTPTAQRLATSERLTRLQSLVAGCGDFDAEFVEILSRARGLTSLKSLVLLWCNLGNEGLSALSRSHAFPGLRKLWLPRTRVSGASVCELARSSSMSSLLDLDLSGNPIGDEGVDGLSHSTCLTNLVNLRMLPCDFSAEASARLAASPTARGLEKIFIGPDADLIQPWTEAPELRPECREYAKDLIDELNRNKPCNRH